MIEYFIMMRMKRFFLGFRNPWRIVLHLVFLLTSWGYGRLFAEITNKASYGELNSVSPEILINFALIIIASITIIRMLLPTYKLQKLVLPKFYPLSKWQRYCLSVVSDFQSAYFFYIAMFVVTNFWFLEYSKVTFLFSGFSVLLSAHLLRRKIHYLIESKLKAFGYVYFAITIAIISVLILNYDFFLHHFKYTSILVPILFFIIGYLLECQVVENKNIELLTSSSKGHYLFKLLVNSTKARLPLVVGLIIKLLLLILDLVLFKTTGKHIFDGQLVYWMIVSPLIVFTYIFNNTWAFWKNIWLNYELRSGKYIDMIKFNLRLLFIPLAIDALITLPILFFSWHNYQFIILFYFVSLIFLVCTSFVWSLVFPITIKSTFQMKGTSSFISSIVATVSVILLSVIKIDNWFYILIPFYLILSFMAYKLAVALYKDKKYLIADRLIKE